MRLRRLALCLTAATLLVPAGSAARAAPMELPPCFGPAVVPVGWPYSEVTCTPWADIPNTFLKHRWGYVASESVRQAFVDVFNAEEAAPQGAFRYSAYVESIRIDRTDIPRTTTCDAKKWTGPTNVVRCRFEFAVPSTAKFDYEIRYFNRTTNGAGVFTKVGVTVT